MKAMILAAGRGERMRPLTDLLPKPLLAVGGKPLIVHHIEKLKAAGVTELVINHAWLGHKLVETLGDGSALGVTIHWSAEESALETAGGIIQALPLLGDEPFLVINGDTWLDLDYRSLVELSLGENLAHLWLAPNPPQHPAGDFALQDGKVVDTPAFTFSGIGLYRPAAFAGLPAGARKLAPLLREWMAQGLVGGYLLAGEWRDIGTVDRLRELDEQLQRRAQ
ncbi:N-acetylmuramate alpha-1-phosphate uridylyltransferase MurU [Aeromonas veronii]|uniref:N-acetylmuramate alpha-1-phosphate uridylyltransferase MurU n=1 Tax=Aeromonas veronii TaxID=654 RepID=UPI001933E12D|nr:nucleotidyltransferase family protein [Aeromonas veronii]MBM0419853.1 NTP transferase domain-containing protein [Aeromonas veronii]MBW3790355.1 nucleotidyltransferase family protein [Aeromonas veronii]